MQTSTQRSHPADGQIARLLDLAEHALAARTFQNFSAGALAVVASMAHSASTLLYVEDPRLLTPFLYQHGFKPDPQVSMQTICARQFKRISSQSGSSPINVSAADAWKMVVNYLYPLRSQGVCNGMLGLMLQDDIAPSIPFWQRLCDLLANAIEGLAEQSRLERQFAHLNTYLTVSSMIIQPLGLHDLLETILYACIDAASAEEASILLLDDEKKNLSFYQIEGPSKPVLMGATFPADRGIAGSVLQSQCSEIIQDVQKDPRFYGKIDSDSGFETKNMIVVPLTAGEERIGVLTVLNKLGDVSFTDEEHRLLLSIAEEIAFAIRNAKVFEYVVDNYCKQRQGLSCKGCKRPLGSWTPCVKYREAAI